MESYHTIFKRRSVRKFNFEPLNQDYLTQIEQYLTQVVQLDGLKCELKLASSSEVGSNKAPHYILAYCEKNALSFINCGFCLQQVDLFIQRIGLGSLWLGTIKPKKDIREDYCIMLAFGGCDLPFRDNENDFSRLKLSEISNEDNMIARAVRVAPSAMNNQPWFCTFNQNEIILDYKSRGVIAPILRRRLSKIDLGIAACHIYLAALNQGLKVRLKPFESASSFGVSFNY